MRNLLLLAALSLVFAQSGNVTTPTICPATLKRNTLASNGVLLDDGNGGARLAVWGQDVAPNTSYYTDIQQANTYGLFTCTLSNRRSVRCYSAAGVDITATLTCSTSSVLSISTGQAWLNVGNMGSWICVIATGGSLSCSNLAGTSMNNGQCSFFPAGHTWSSISAADGSALGAYCTCGINSLGALFCWGNGVTSNDGSRCVGGVPSGPAPFSLLATGQCSFCAVNGAGSLVCWGSCAPAGLSGNQGPWISVATGDGSVGTTCGIDSSFFLRCSNTAYLLPTLAQRWRSVTVFSGGICGVAFDGTFYCRGSLVVTDSSRIWIKVSLRTGCAFDFSGFSQCWNRLLVPPAPPVRTASRIIFATTNVSFYAFVSPLGTLAVSTSGNDEVSLSATASLTCNQFSLGTAIAACFSTPNITIFSVNSSQSKSALTFQERFTTSSGLLSDLLCSDDSCCWTDSASNLSCRGLLFLDRLRSARQSVFLPGCAIILLWNGSMFSLNGASEVCAAAVAVAPFSNLTRVAAGIDHRGAAIVCGIGDSSSLACWSPTETVDLSGRLDTPTIAAANMAAVWVTGPTVCAQQNLIFSTIICWGQRASMISQQYSAAYSQDSTVQPAWLSYNGICIYQSRLFETAGIACLGSLPLSTRADSMGIIGSLALPPTQLAMSRNHGCVRNDRSAITCWGNDAFGQVSGAPKFGLNIAVADGVSCSPSSAKFITCGGSLPSLFYNGSGAICDTIVGPSALVVVDALVATQHTLLNRTFIPFSNIAARLGSRAAFSDFDGAQFVCVLNASGFVQCPSLLTGGMDLNPPTNIKNPLLDVCSGAGHACGIRSDSTISCWGPPGVGVVFWPLSATAFPKVPGPFYDISCGPDFSCTIDANKNVFCWGGSGADARANIVPSVVAPLSSFVRGWAADSFCLIVSPGAAIACYSNGWSGRPSTLQATGAASGVSASLVTLGPSYGCFLASGTASLVCWGDGFAYRAASVSFTVVPARFSNTSSVSVAYQHACAAAANSSILYCWGDPDFNRFNGSAPATSLGWNITAVSTGFAHTCIISAENRTLRCWGGGSNSTIRSPLQLVRADNAAAAGPFSPSPTSVCSGKWFICSIDIGSSPSQLRCFNTSAPDFNEITSLLLQLVVAPRGGISMVACGEYHVCTIALGTQSLSCTAVTTRSELTPSAALLVPSLGGNAWRDVSCGRAHTCGITTGNNIFCWGDTAWQQGPAVTVVKYPISSTSDPAYNNIILVGILSSGDLSCSVNKSCATLTQAASLFITGNTIFYIVSNLTLSAQVIFSPLCDKCQLLPHPNLTAASISVWITVPSSFNTTAASSDAAIIVQSSLTISNVIFTSGADAGAGVGISSVVQATSTVQNSIFSLSQVSFVTMAPPHSVQNMSALTSIVRVATAGSASFTNIVISGPGTSTLRFLDVISASSITLKGVLADGSSKDVSSMAASVPQAFVSITGGVYRVQMSQLVMNGRQAPFASIITSSSVTFLALSSIVVTSSSFSSFLTATNTLSISLSTASIFNASFQSLVHSPFNGLIDKVVAVAVNISSITIASCSIGGPSLAVIPTTINGSSVLGAVFNRPLLLQSAVAPLDTLVLDSVSVSSSSPLNALSSTRIAIVATNTSFAAISISAFEAAAAPFDFLASVQLACQSYALGSAKSAIFITNSMQLVPTSMRILSLTPTPEAIEGWFQPDTSVTLSGIAWNWLRPVLATLQPTIFFDSSPIVILDTPTAYLSLSSINLTGLNSSFPSSVSPPFCGLVCFRILPPSSFFSGGAGTYTITNALVVGVCSTWRCTVLELSRFKRFLCSFHRCFHFHELLCYCGGRRRLHIFIVLTRRS